MSRFIIFIILLMGVAVSAQESTSEPDVTPAPEQTAEATADVDACPMLVTNALQFTQTNCSDADTNQACYGYTFIDAELRSELARFAQPGDIEDVIDIQSVQLSPLNTVTGEWGVFVLRVEPNATPDENDTPITDDLQIVLYGDAQLQDATQFIEVTAISNVNIREFPRTNAAILDSLQAEETLVANGRLEDNSWFRVRVNTEDSVTNGWISADFLDETTFNAETLPLITTEQAQQPQTDIAATYGPMQAFVFESGRADAPCEQAPNSGMLIQTPDGAASVNILLDEVVIQLDGTGVISAQADGNLTVGVIEGTAQVEAEGGTSTAVAGQAVDVPLDSNLAPSAQPEAPRLLTPDEVQALPTDLLDDSVTIPPIGDDSGITLANPSDGFGWTFSYTTPPPYICSDGSEIVFESSGVAPSVSLEADALVLSGLRHTEVSNGVYRASYVDGTGTLITNTLQITSSDRISGEQVLDFSSPTICTLTVSFVIQLSAR